MKLCSGWSSGTKRYNRMPMDNSPSETVLCSMTPVPRTVIPARPLVASLPSTIRAVPPSLSDSSDPSIYASARNSVGDTREDGQSEPTDGPKPTAEPTWRQALAAHRRLQEESCSKTMSKDDVFSVAQNAHALCNINGRQDQAIRVERITAAYLRDRALNNETPTPESRSLRFAQTDALKSYPNIASVLVATDRVGDAHSETDITSVGTARHAGEVLGDKELADSSRT